MNPSSAGWIHKFINDFPRETLIDPFDSPLAFYDELKETGFIYGVSVNTLLKEPISNLTLTKEEYTKINLFHALLYTYFYQFPKAKYDEAIEKMVAFYRSIERGKTSFIQKLTFNNSQAENLEKILAARLQETNELLKTDAALLLTHALLYVDVLSFAGYLKKPKDLKTYTEMLERTLIEQSIRALQSKKKKNKYDHLVIELVTSTSEFVSNEPIHFTIPDNIINSPKTLERQFILDICCLAVWDDKKLDEEEHKFLKKLAKELGFTPKQLNTAIKTLIHFSESNAQKIKLFEYSHPVKQFYKQSTRMVNKLILRNKKRLITELNESGELLLLLSQSTLRELSSEEKTKVKEQLLDIFKTIPSLTIFILPGGMLLLPLVVKLIPKLLPSAFHENRVDEEKK